MHKASSKTNKEQHMRSVDGVTRYPCEQCEYMATRKESLDRHKNQFIEG